MKSIAKYSYFGAINANCIREPDGCLVWRRIRRIISGGQLLRNIWQRLLRFALHIFKLSSIINQFFTVHKDASRILKTLNLKELKNLVGKIKLLQRMPPLFWLKSLRRIRQEFQTHSRRSGYAAEGFSCSVRSAVPCLSI